MDVYANYMIQQNGIRRQQQQTLGQVKQEFKHEFAPYSGSSSHVVGTGKFVAMPLLQQTGKVFVGPGQQREAQLIGLGLRKLKTFEREDIERAKRYALDQSVKFVMLKQREAHQQQNGQRK